MVARVNTVAFQGLDVQPIDVQVQISNGMPAFTIVGLPDKAVGESKERVRAALHALGIALPAKRLTVNLAPADVAKEGSHYDLPIALGLLSAMGIIAEDALSSHVVLGELSLDSRVRGVGGILPAALYAAQNDNGLVCPADGGCEAAWAGDLEIIAPADLLQLINHFKGTQLLSRPIAALPENDKIIAASTPNLANVKGQEIAKRALEIAAAGGHNLLLCGPPGAGKSMLASCMPAILPPLSPAEALDVSMIHSISGTLPAGGLITTRPFRSPHHSASQPALIGGGTKAKPGEISLAHHGVLFLDELPEFARNALESLRQPLESGQAVIARANRHVTYPARFQLIAAMNPCRCGYLGDPDQACSKAPRCGQDYQSKISGPLLDRFDLRVDVSAVKVSDLIHAPKGTDSATIASRIKAARALQESRYQAHQDQMDKLINAAVPAALTDQIFTLDADGQKLIENAAERLKLSARAYHRILRVARTIADLDAVEQGKNQLAISKDHIREALGYRPLQNNFS